MIYALAFGFLTGLRSLSPTACIAWAAYLERIRLPRPLARLGTPLGVLILGVLALAELVADKLPRTPNRTAPPVLAARLVMGALAGACVGPALWSGALLGSLGALAGTYLGFYARTGTVNALALPDLKVALLEDFLCLATALFLLSRL